MEYINFILLIVIILLCYLEISKLKKQVSQQQKQLDELCELTKHETASSCYLSEEVKSEIIRLKTEGRETEAVKKIREHTSMSLLEAKQYMDTL